MFPPLPWQTSMAMSRRGEVSSAGKNHALRRTSSAAVKVMSSHGRPRSAAAAVQSLEGDTPDYIQPTEHAFNLPESRLRIQLAFIGKSLKKLNAAGTTQFHVCDDA